MPPVRCPTEISHITELQRVLASYLHPQPIPPLHPESNSPSHDATVHSVVQTLAFSWFPAFPLPHTKSSASLEVLPPEHLKPSTLFHVTAGIKPPISCLNYSKLVSLLSSVSCKAARIIT